MLARVSPVSGIPDVPGVPPERVAYLIRTHETHSTRQQAQELGLSDGCVRRNRAELYRAGLLQKTRRKHNRPFSADERARTLALLHTGMRLGDIAAAVGRGRSSVSFFLCSQGVDVRALHDAAQTYTQLQCSKMLGISNTTVRRLCAAGALPSARLGPPRPNTKRRKARDGHTIGDRRHYLISRADLIAFLANRRYWMVWHAAGVRDDDLRRLAELYRRATPGEWLTLRAVVTSQHYAKNTTDEWVARGWPGPGWEVELWGNTRYIWIPAGSALPGRLPERHRWQGRKRAA